MVKQVCILNRVRVKRDPGTGGTFFSFFFFSSELYVDGRGPSANKLQPGILFLFLDPACLFQPPLRLSPLSLSLALFLFLSTNYRGANLGATSRKVPSQCVDARALLSPSPSWRQKGGSGG